jgi:putative addiction module component (TIGR02574 family)
MTDEAKAIIEKAMQLSESDRELLVELILESLSPPPKLSKEQIAELERRDRLYREDPSRAIPWEQAREEIRAAVMRRLSEDQRRADAS